MCLRYLSGFVAGVGGVILSAAGALCVYDADSGVTDLSVSGAWVDGAIPGADDVAVFDGETPEVLMLGASTTWLGVVRTNTVNGLTLQAPEGGTLTLGGEGVTLRAKDETEQRLSFDVALALEEDQTWSWDKNMMPTTRRALTGPGALTLRPEADDDGVQVGDVMFGGAVTTAVTTEGSVSIFLWQDGSMTPAPTLSKGASLVAVTTPKAGGTTFADLFPSRSVGNAGVFNFGGVDGSTAYSNQTNTFLLSAGDALTGPGGSETSREAGRIHVQDAHIVADGAAVTQNVWFDLRNGSWMQKSGETSFSYGGVVGRGSSMAYGMRDQRLQIEGGVFETRRLTVGLANGDSGPAEVWVSGGAYRSVLPNAESDNLWSAGLGLAQRSMNNEDVAGSDWAAGRLEISGGSVTTPALFFGAQVAGASNPYDNRSGARLALSAGRLEVGLGGVRTGKYWQDDESMDRSWYDVDLSGGTLAFYRSGTTSTADMRLSDRHGGVTMEVPASISPVTISGSLYGTGGLRKTGGGTLALSGANDYTGRTVVEEGRLAVSNGRFETAVWTGDSLAALAEGESVVPWKTAGTLNASNSWSFSLVTSIQVTKDTTAPTLARNAMNGHHAVSFDGAQTCLLSGNAAQPIDKMSAFTVAMVLQTEPDFVGIASTNIAQALQFFGTSMSDAASNTGRRYGLALDEKGRIGCGMFGGKWKDGDTKTMTPENLWSEVAINDGRPHVIVWTWTWKKEHVLRVDDQVYRLASPSNGVGTTQRTRIVLGVGEQQKNTTTPKRFKGAIADLRMASGAVSESRSKQLARELGVRYGVAAFADETLWGEEEEQTAKVPEATATWLANTLSQGAGESVDDWSEKDGKGASSGSPWTFSRSVVEKILPKLKSYPGATTSPVIAEKTLAGRKLVSFNGQDAGLAMSASNATPIGGKDGMTVAIVVRFPRYGIGGGEFNPGTSAPLLGSDYAESNDKENWQLLLSGAARVGVSHRRGKGAQQTLRSRQRFLNDGEAHVVVARYPKQNSDGTVTLFVDGYKDTSSYVTSATINNTRILLGCGEYSSTASYAAMELAELRMYGGEELTDAQVRALSEELAQTYELELAPYTRGVAVDGQQRSREVVVAEGAEFGGVGGFGTTLYPGQTLEGAGSVCGLLTVAPGASLKVASQEGLTLTDGVEFLDGAELTIATGTERTAQPIAVTGNVTLRGTTVVRLADTAKRWPTGPILTWTGALDAADEPTFTVEGVSARNMRVKVNAEKKWIRLVSTGGLRIVLR